MSILIVYGTVEGQTRKIAEFAAQVARAEGFPVRLLDAADARARADFHDVDCVIAAASVHQRRHPEKFEAFLTAHRDDLAARSTLMLSVSLGAAFPEKYGEAQDYLDEMKLRTGFRPKQEMLVAGAIRGASYDYFATQVLRHVVLRDSDAARDLRDHEFTDWVALGVRLAGFYAQQSVDV